VQPDSAAKMLTKAVIVWIVGLLTIVPYGTYYLLFEAQRDQYAVLITLVLFWIFGFWGVVGPILGAIKVRRVFQAIERAQSKDDLLALLRSPDSQVVAIDLIASENHIPRFLAARVFNLLVSRFSSANSSLAASETPSNGDAGSPKQ
jgi:hypothetical protein